MSVPASPADAAAPEWTVRRVLEWTIAHLKQRGSETPRLDAEVLLAHAWSCPRIQLYTRYDQPLPPAVRATMRELVQRRANAEPVAYLVGRREFFSLEFEIPKGVFIPRPSTETLIVEALRRAESLDAPRILDLCTGSGCIAVTLAHSLPSAIVTAVDLNPIAVAAATRNAERLGVADRVRVLEGNLFQPLNAGEAFDIIVSNPPYVRDDEMAGLPRDVRDHEPPLALVAGSDGLDVIRCIASNLPPYLNRPGALFIELSPQHAHEARELLLASGEFDAVDLVRDLDRVDRILRATRGA